MTVHVQKPLPHELMALCSESPAGLILRRLASFAPRYLTRDELILEGRISGPALHRYVAFENLILNRDINRLGWTIARESPYGTIYYEVKERYRLEELH